jgi:Ser/Thr protein kinase RdoA (MazF antagonist)
VLGELLSEPAPDVSTREVECLAREQFNIDGSATPLPGERDRNFRLHARDRNMWVVKVVHPREDAAVTELRGRALEHVALRNPALPTPRLRRPQPGDQLDVCWTRAADSASTRVQLYSYLPGRPIYRATPSPIRQRRLGALLARLDVALSDLDHEVEPYGLAWDASNLERVRPLLLATADGRSLIRVADHFADHAAAILPGLRHQLIHNDGNPNNVLTGPGSRPDITGIIDFGDMISAPPIQELATAAAYQIPGTGHPLAAPARLAAGYDAVRRLSSAEIAVLFDLMAARLVLGVAIAAWRARHRAHPGHFLMRARQTRASLERLTSVGCTAAGDYFRRTLDR